MFSPEKRNNPLHLIKNLLISADRNAHRLDAVPVTTYIYGSEDEARSGCHVVDDESMLEPFSHFIALVTPMLQKEYGLSLVNVQRVTSNKDNTGNIDMRSARLAPVGNVTYKEFVSATDRMLSAVKEEDFIAVCDFRIPPAYRREFASSLLADLRNAKSILEKRA